MKAAVYEGRRTVTVKDVPDAKIEHPCDILVKITATNIYLRLGPPRRAVCTPAGTGSAAPTIPRSTAATHHRFRPGTRPPRWA